MLILCGRTGLARSFAHWDQRVPAPRNLGVIDLWTDVINSDRQDPSIALGSDDSAEIVLQTCAEVLQVLLGIGNGDEDF